MTLADANDLAQVIGAVAVVASLVFVGVQMRQNTRAVRASMSQAHAATYQDMAGRIYASEELAKIWMKGNLSPDQLSDVERARFVLILAAQFRFWDACFTQFREGQLPEAHWRSIERMILNNGGNPGIRAWWERRRETMSPEFRAWYENQTLAEGGHLLAPFGPTRTGGTDSP